MKASAVRIRASALSRSIASAALVFLLLSLEAEPGGRFVTEGFLGKRGSSDVQVRSTPKAVTFVNADGEWTIFKQCLGTDIAGVGYIARYISRVGYIVSNDYLEGGFGELNNPEHGGVGSFGLELARGAGERHWDNTWHLTMRRCGPFGVTAWTRPSFGRLADGTGFYDQDVWLGDNWTRRMLLIRYRWRFDPAGVRLYGLVASRCGDCPSELGEPFVKEPKLLVTLNGQASEERFSHISTFGSTGVGIRDRECAYAGRDARRETGHCFHEQRERVRWDYGDTAQGGCNVTTRLCFNAVFRSYPTHGLTLRVGEAPGPWENHGLESWALDAAEQPSAGTGGCLTIDGQAVYSPDQENARNWEYAVNRPEADEGYTSSMVMAKGWDGCRHSLDATSLYRRLELRSYGFFLSLSLGSGWSRR